MDARIFEAHGQVGTAFTTGDDAAAGLLDGGKVDVPQPGEVLAVGHLAIDADDNLVDARVDHRHGLLPTGGVLGKHEARASTVDIVDGVASGDLGDTTDGRSGSRGVDAHGDGGGDGLRGIAKVGAPGKLQFEGDADTVRSTQRRARPLGGQLDVLEPPLRLRTAAEIREFLAVEGGDQVPVLAGADDAATARVCGGVCTPSTTGRNPHDVRIVGGGRDDQRVVAVGDDDGVRMRRCPVAQTTLDGADFADAVELIAREIQVHEDRWIDVGGDAGHVHFVDLKGCARRPLTLHEGRQDTGGHIVAVDVRGDGPRAFQRRAHHTRGRRLAVRAGHDDGGEGGSQFLEELRGDTQGNLAADHAPGAAPKGTRCEAGGATGRCGQARAHRQVMRRIRHASTLTHAGHRSRR